MDVLKPYGESTWVGIPPRATTPKLSITHKIGTQNSKTIGTIEGLALFLNFIGMKMRDDRLDLQQQRPPLRRATPCESKHAWRLWSRHPFFVLPGWTKWPCKHYVLLVGFHGGRLVGDFY